VSRAEGVAKWFRDEAGADNSEYAVTCLALADLVEAGARVRLALKVSQALPQAQVEKYDAAEAALAKALGVEGE
jgi:hypothetical protein